MKLSNSHLKMVTVWVCLLIALGGCANDSRPTSPAEFAEKWVNAVSHINGQDMNCRIAHEWASPDMYRNCEDVFKLVQEQYLKIQERFQKEGKDDSVDELDGVRFECRLEEAEVKKLEPWQKGIPIVCVDDSEVGVQVYIEGQEGPLNPGSS